ncbi:NADP-dependent oxidoreductase [Pedobacter antarcticus]|uniref:NADP-dependent oxidoreductase n=1 Tax=Pedobacter antarcticus TaxID=34086 RepID=UPI0029310667|nr:NADP-dependent oxidoreductase [Pedobacter antarcticus]
MSKVIVLQQRPAGKPVLTDFEFQEEPVARPGKNELLLKTLYVSVDPYLRGRMSDAKSYVPPFKVGAPIQSGIVAEVTESNHPDFKKGNFVSGNLDWREMQVSDGKGLTVVDNDAASLSAYLGILGMTGLTAYLGLTEIGKPQKGETLVVSGAAGAVGSVVGQIGKILGCKVIGIAGSEKKLALLKDKFGFDEAINYKTTKDMNQAIKDAAPDGVDIYFDNVGGEISDAVLASINKFGRVPVCGAISLYNNTEVSVGPRVQPILVKNSALMQGFIVSNFADKFPEAIKPLTAWLKEGKLNYTETIVEGFDQIPQAFIDLFEGKNEGKMIVKV